MTVLKRLPFTKALKALLADGMPDHMPVGLVVAPRKEVPGSTPPKWETLPPPYVVLIPLGTVHSGPPFAAPDVDADWTYQVTMVSQDASQLEWMRDQVETLILARDETGGFETPLELTGYRVMSRYPKDDSGGDPTPDDRQYATLQSPLRFGFKVTPTG